MKTIQLKNKSLQPETSGNSNTIINKKLVTMKKHETKPFKLNILGIFILDTAMEKLSFPRLMLLIAVVMSFILGIVLVLKWYAIPAFGLSTVTKISKSAIGKITKSRAP